MNLQKKKRGIKITSNKAVLTIICIALFFTVIVTPNISGGDIERHYYKAKTNCLGDAGNVGWTNDACLGYSPLLSMLSNPFTNNKEDYKQAVNLIILILTPLILYYVSKDWIVTWFYFTTTNYVYFFMGGLYSQALANIFVLAILIKKDYRIDILLIFLAHLSHSHGLILALIVIGAKYLNKIDLRKEIVCLCSGFFMNERPEILETKIEKITPIKLTNTGKPMEIRDILHLFIKIYPLPYMYWSVKAALRNKPGQKFLLISIISLIAGTVFSARIYYLIPLMLLTPLAWYYRDLDKKQKRLFLIFTLLTGIIQFILFWNLKTCIAAS